MANTREIGALVGAVCILFAALTHNLLTFDGQGVELGVGFRGLNICKNSSCATINTHSGLGTFAFFLGLLAAAGLVGAVVMERTQDDERLWRPAGLLALLFVLASIGWYVDMSMSGASIGIGLFAGVLGASAASLVALASERENSIATYQRVTERGDEIEAGLAKYYKNPAASGAPAAPAESERPPATQPAPGAASPADVDLPLPMPPQALARPAVDLRFAAASAQITEAGVLALSTTGERQQLRFGHVKQLVARRLPEELGHGPVLLLDLVGVDAPNHPIRILPTTKLEFASLPQGPGRDPRESVRGLVRLVLSHQPDLQMDEGTKAFADSGTGLPFKTLDHFWQYDGRYPA